MALSIEEQERIRKRWESRQNGGTENASVSTGSTVKDGGAGTGASSLSDSDKARITERWNSRFDIDESFVNTFLTDANKFLTQAQTDYDKLDWNTATSESSLNYYKSMQQTENDLSNRATKIQNYLNVNKGKIDSETYNNLSSYLKNFTSPQFSKLFFDARDYYSQWESADAYDTAVRQAGYQKKYEGKSYSDAKTILADMEDGEEKQWLTSFVIEAGEQELEEIKQQYMVEIPKQAQEWMDKFRSTSDEALKKQYFEQAKALEEKALDLEQEYKEVDEYLSKLKNEPTWFKNNHLFDDGWQFGDVTKTVLGSGADLLENIGSGIVGLGEVLLDAVLTVAPYVAQGQYYQNGGGYNLQADRLFDQTIEAGKKGNAEIVKKDLYDENAIAKAIISDPLKSFTGIDAETDSVFGEKTDSLAQSVGQLLAQNGANVAVPGSGMALMAASALGSEAENALKNDATLDEAAFSGVFSAAAEVITEKIGGISFGGKTLTDGITDKFAQKATSKIAKLLVGAGKISLNALAEGGEEILSGYASAVGQKMSYMSDKELEELFSNEDALDAFIGGVVLGGLGEVGDIAKSAHDGVSYATGLAKNGQTGSAAVAGQPAQQTVPGKLDIDELVDETIAQQTGAPADPVGAAVDGFRQTGTVTNKQATDILNSVKAVQQIVKETGVKLDGLTASQKRQAVKTAVEQMAQQKTAVKEHISLEDYVNRESPVWRNVEYTDDATKATIMQETHEQMVNSGSVVTVTDGVMKDVDQSFPDLRGMKKKERTPILRDALNKLKTNIRQFLSGLANQNFEFEVNGKVLDAKLYSTGINEVMEKVTQEKANMLYSTQEIFRNARYLYSTPDYDGDPNVYRWNYFYTPVQIGEDTVGVRIAVRDMATPQESQIYNWGIKKDASLDGAGRGTEDRISSGVSSDASNKIIPNNSGTVNKKNGAVSSGLDTAQQTDYDDIITQGGRSNGTEQTAQASDQRRNETGARGISGRGQASQADRSGVSGSLGEAGEGTSEIHLPGQQQVDHGGIQRNPQNDTQRETARSTADGSRNVQFSHQSRIYGRDGKGTFHTSDSEGRELTPEQSANLRDTAVTDSNGAPLAAYHITDNMDFTTFAKGDTGFHFGSAEQAERHGKQRGYTNGRTFRVYLNIKNPFRTSKDIMGWHPGGTALRLWNDGALTESEMQEITALYRMGDGYDSASAVRLREILESKGYDGIVYANGFEGDGDSYIAFHDNQIIRSEITEFSTDTSLENAHATPSVGAADKGFSPKYEAIDRYGNIPEGENPTRVDQLPRSTDGQDRVSYTARTALEAKVTPDEFAPLIENETMKGGFSFIPLKNTDVVQEAEAAITKAGWEGARNNWTADVRAGKSSPKLTAIGALLYNNAVNSGDYGAAMDILMDYQLSVRNSAQALQAARILKTLSPSDRLYMIQKSVDQMVEDMHLDTDVTIDEDLQEEYLHAETEEARDAVIDKIQQHVADQIPSTLMEKWTALRYVNMLGNLRTQLRNVFGNAGMKVVSSAKNAVATAIETIAHKASGGKFRRTKSLTVSKELLKACRSDFSEVESIIQGGGKYSDSRSDSTEFARGVKDKQTVFKFKPLEGYRKLTNRAMEKGDLRFSRAAYARAQAGYLKANGVTGSDLSSVDSALLDDARLYAVQEAQEQTFRDTNWLSGWVSKVGRRKDTPTAGKVISEGIMPFRKTPANVLVRAEEYSPLGIINSVVTSIKALQKDSDITGAQVVNSWAKSLTGTGIFGLGMLLQSLGWLSAGPDDDEDKDSFDSMNGWQNYAFTLPDGTNLTIDFFTPSAIPLLMGAELMQLMQDGNITVKDIESALTSLADPMVEMSMLQGVNDTLDNVRYAENNLGQMVINSALSYLTQGLTNTLVGQLERTFEDSRMQTYVDKDSPLPDWLQRILGKASAKTPIWEYGQIPYINAWGEEEENPATGLNAVYNLLSPSYIEKGISTELTQELNRLNSVQSDINVYPSTPDKTVTFENQSYNLSKEEYVSLAKLQGQTQKQLVEDLISHEGYASLSDENKAKAIRFAYAYARDSARGEVVPDHPGITTKWMAELEGDIAEGILRHVTQSGLTDALSSVVSSWKDIGGSQKAIADLEQVYKTFTGLSDAMQENIFADSGGRVKYFLTAKDAGISSETFANLYKTFYDIDNGSGKASEKASQWSYALEKAQEQGVITSSQKAALKEEMNFWQMIPAETSRFDELTGSGLSADKASYMDELLDSILPPAGKSGVTQQQKIAAITSADDRLSDKEQQQVLQDILPESAYGKYLEILELGYSNDDYSDSYRIYTQEKETGGKGTKARTIEAFQKEFGISEAAATALYEVYVPK